MLLDSNCNLSPRRYKNKRTCFLDVDFPCFFNNGIIEVRKHISKVAWLRRGFQANFCTSEPRARSNRARQNVLSF